MPGRYVCPEGRTALLACVLKAPALVLLRADQVNDAADVEKHGAKVAVLRVRVTALKDEGLEVTKDAAKCFRRRGVAWRGVRSGRL